ncbi:DNA primase [Kaustia mangrovi]|nr:DNA primase [Kaustia mangrovi]
MSKQDIRGQAMRFSEQFLDEIRARVSLSQVVGRKVQWDRRKSVPARGDYWACCPFHNEKTPSFHADDRRGRYHCFGCKASGDIFRFVTETEGLSFPEAVERLAEQAGLPMPVQSREEGAREEKRRSLADVMEAAAAFFENALRQPAGAGARAYLERREVSGSLARQFRLGFAPDERYGLKTHLAEQGFDVEMMAAAGLVVTGEDIAVAFDRFRGRIMFPIRDRRGRVIAFGGRAMDPKVPAKYLNSPETALFHKGNVLYNLDQARAPAHEAGMLMAVEGYMDVIALARAGIAQAVAPLGTALTADQLNLMWRVVPEPILCFDGDEAGLHAAYRAVDTALGLVRPGYSLRFAFLPEGQDPDDLVRAGGREAMDAVLKAAEPLSDVLWRRELEQADLTTPERRAAFESRLDEAVGHIADNRVQTHYRSDLKNRLNTLWRGLSGGNGGRAGERGRMDGRMSGRFAGGGQRPWSGRGGGGRLPLGPSHQLRQFARSALARPASERRERLMVLTLVNHPHLVDENLELLAEMEFESPELDRLRAAILDIAALEEALDRTQLRDHLSRRGFEQALARLETGLTHRSDWFAFADAALDDVITAWRHMVALHRKSVTLRRELDAAERAFAENPTQDALAHLNEVREQMRSTVGEEASIEGFGTASGRVGGGVG